MKSIGVNLNQNLGFNDIMQKGENLYGDKVDFSFITALETVSGEDIDFINVFGIDPLFEFFNMSINEQF